MAEEGSVLIVEGENGARYAIPSEALAAFELPDGATIDQDDVEGHNWNGWNWNYWWTPRQNIISNDGGSIVTNTSANFNNRWWG